MAIVFPFSLLSYTRMKSYYGGILLTMVLTGVACFMIDRNNVAPLHSVWHILSAGAVSMTLYYVVVNGVVA
jgi:heme/copper-type cytochrome/quinol oxidase subunit 4